MIQRCLPPLILMMLALPAVAAPAPEAVVARVVGLFVQDDLAHLAATVPGEQDLRRQLDELECISVRNVAWEVVFRDDDELTLRIDVDATGTTTAAWRPEKRLPPSWYVEAELAGDDWRIVSLLSAERRMAKDMLAAPTTDDAECLFAEAVNPGRVVMLYADVIDDNLRSDRMPHARVLAESLGEPHAMIAVLRLEATLLFRGGDTASVDVARSALELARRAGTADEVVDATFTLGVTLMLTARTQDALEQFSAAGDMVERIDYPVIAIKALHMYAWLAGKDGRLLELLRTSERVTALARRYRWREGEIIALSEIATVHVMLGNEKLYTSYIEEARRIAVSNGDRANITRFDFNYAQTLITEGRLDEALPLLEAVVANADSLPSTDWTEVQIGHASLFIDLGRYAEAEEALAKAETYALLPARILLARSRLELERGRYAESIEAARRAIDTQMNEPFEFASMGQLAVAFAWMGRALRRSGRVDEAIEALRASLSADDQTVASIGLLVSPTRIDSLPAYFDLIELLVARRDVKEALRVAERMRARSLRDALERGHIDLSATMTDEERKREQALTERLAVANRARLSALSGNRSRAGVDAELDAVRIELDGFREEMRVAHPAFARRQPQQDDEPRLPAGSQPLAVVEYVVAETQTIAFVLASDAETVAVPIAVSAKELERRANELSTLVSGRSVAYRAVSRRMYDLLLAPLERHLGGRTALCVIPDGPLWSIPFHALIAPDGGFVLDRRPVFYASSLALLRGAMERPSKGNPTLIAFGNPNVGSAARTTVRSAFRDVSLGPLVDAEKEAIEVSRMYGSGSRSYVRDGAREAVFKSEAPAYGIVHVAAHAIVDHRAPMYSAIVLSAKGDDLMEDGLLEGREVADLPLQAELAVLSACDTARGKAGYGDGVIGLGWAFQAAGTPTLVVSQWQAESRATAELMIEFHRRLRAGATIANALRQAQLSLRRRYPHPFYWAPFVAVGAAAKPLGGRYQ